MLIITLVHRGQVVRYSYGRPFESRLECSGEEGEETSGFTRRCMERDDFRCRCVVGLCFFFVGGGEKMSLILYIMFD